MGLEKTVTYEAAASDREFSDGKPQKRKGRKPLGSGPENLLEGQVYGPEILAANTTKRISMQRVIIHFQYHEYRLAVNVDR